MIYTCNAAEYSIELTCCAVLDGNSASKVYTSSDLVSSNHARSTAEVKVEAQVVTNSKSTS